MNRRGLLGGLLVALAAPAIIRTPGLLMPVRPVRPVAVWWRIPEMSQQLAIRELTDLLSMSHALLDDMVWIEGPIYRGGHAFILGL